MFYSNHSFLLPGDFVTAGVEERNVHKGEKYEVTQVFHDRGNLVYVIKDKWGEEITPRYQNEFEIPSKTATLSEQRRLRSRFASFWDGTMPFTSKDEKLGGGHRYQWERIWFYELSRASFASDSKMKGRVTREKIDPTGEGGWKHFRDQEFEIKCYSKEDFLTQMTKLASKSKDIDWEFTIPHTSYETTRQLDTLAFIAEYNIPAKPNLFDVLYKNIEYWRGTDDKDKFFEYLAQESFDVLTWNETSQQDKELARDIMTLFRDLPSSHSSTSISKFLTGASKVKIHSLRHLDGKYKDVYKRQLIYEAANTISGHLSRVKIFTTKEDYGSADEWRDHFEFIGNKIVDSVKLQQYLEY